MTGWAKDWRAGWNHHAFRTLQEAAVFKWMCAHASYAPRRIATRYGPVDLHRGEILISERFLADQFGLHKNAIRRLKRSLIDEGMILVFRDRCPKLSGTIALIVNYDEYQGDNSVEINGQDHERTNNRTATGPRRDRDGTTREEVKESKKENIELPLNDKPVKKQKRKTSIPDGFPDEKALLWARGHFSEVGKPHLNNGLYELFRDKSAALSWCYADWRAGFRNFCKNQVDWDKGHAVAAKTEQTSPYKFGEDAA